MLAMGRVGIGGRLQVKTREILENLQVLGVAIEVVGDKLHLIENVAYNLYGKIYKVEMS